MFFKQNSASITKWYISFIKLKMRFCTFAIMWSQKAYTINILVTDRIAQKIEMLNEYLLRVYHFALLRDLRYALLRNLRFCAILHNCDGFILQYCNIVTLRYCDITQQIADCNVADSCRRVVQRQSSHISISVMCFNDWIKWLYWQLMVNEIFFLLKFISR